MPAGSMTELIGAGRLDASASIKALVTGFVAATGSLDLEQAST